jgi:hypothetical protein
VGLVGRAENLPLKRKTFVVTKSGKCLLSAEYAVLIKVASCARRGCISFVITSLTETCYEIFVLLANYIRIIK